MGRIERITDRLRSGQRIVIDGGTGTELERRGVPKLENAWNGGGTLSHPDVLRQIHIEHIEAGAEIIISNTFATSRYILESAGVGQTSTPTTDVRSNSLLRLATMSAMIRSPSPAD